MKKQIKDKKIGQETFQKLAGGRGGGNFKFGFGNEVTHPCNGSFATPPPLELGLKYHDPPPLVYMIKSSSSNTLG